MSIYRRIYEEHNGSIPIDDQGRTYDIHHIDGDRTNNDPSNLIALSKAEHFKVHLNQGDYGAANLISKNLDITPEERSELARLNALKRVKNGTHPFLDKEANSKRQRAKLEAGTHPFLTLARKLMENGTHNAIQPHTCPHCNKVGKGPMMFRWHFDNCKNR